jgi:metal-responsive CopG/Arc/MetJ family transcriptional regulator
VGVRIAFRLPEPALAALDERARAADISRSEALRTLVEDALRGSDDGVDRSQIEARLALSPAERVRTMARDAGRLAVIRGRAAS